MKLTPTPPAPTWVDFAPDSVRGLDLLGLRIPVQRIGGALFNGVTTISPKVRYLSFRTFLADAYRNLPGPPPDSNRSFVEFAASAESALALGHALTAPETSNVIGIDGARKALEERSSDRVLLERFVSQLAVNAYAGPAEDLGFVGIRTEGAPSVDEQRGLPLADIMRSELAETAIGRALLEEGRLETASVDELFEFGEKCNLDRPLESERWILIDAILPEAPRPTEVERLRTYALLLHLASQIGEREGRLVRAGDVFRAAADPRTNVPDVLTSALDGWLVYQIRDSLAVAHEAAFGEVVAALPDQNTSPGGVTQTDALDTLLEDGAAFEALWGDLDLPGAFAGLDSMGMAGLQQRVQDACGEDAGARSGLRRWEGGLTEQDLIEARRRYGTGALMLLPLSWILAEWRAGQGVREELPLFDGLSVDGPQRLGMHEVLLPRLARLVEDDVPIDIAIAELVSLTVHQHVQIALSRLAQDPNRDVTVIRTDGDRWIKIRNFAPGQAASRLPQAIGWLEQLGLISSRGLTAEGRRLYERAVDTLARGGTS